MSHRFKYTCLSAERAWELEIAPSLAPSTLAGAHSAAFLRRVSAIESTPYLPQIVFTGHPDGQVRLWRLPWEPETPIAYLGGIVAATSMSSAAVHAIRLAPRGGPLAVLLADGHLCFYALTVSLHTAPPVVRCVLLADVALPAAAFHDIAWSEWDGKAPASLYCAAGTLAIEVRLAPAAAAAAAAAAGAADAADAADAASAHTPRTRCDLAAALARALDDGVGGSFIATARVVDAFPATACTLRGCAVCAGRLYAVRDGWLLECRAAECTKCYGANAPACYACGKQRAFPAYADDGCVVVELGRRASGGHSAPGAPLVGAAALIAVESAGGELVRVALATEAFVETPLCSSGGAVRPDSDRRARIAIPGLYVPRGGRGGREGGGDAWLADGAADGAADVEAAEEAPWQAVTALMRPRAGHLDTDLILHEAGDASTVARYSHAQVWLAIGTRLGAILLYDAHSGQQLDLLSEGVVLETPAEWDAGEGGELTPAARGCVERDIERIKAGTASCTDIAWAPYPAGERLIAAFASGRVVVWDIPWSVCEL